MIHAVGDILGLYERSEIDAYLASDAAQIRQYLGINEQTPPQLRLESAE